MTVEWLGAVPPNRLNRVPRQHGAMLTEEMES